MSDYRAPLRDMRFVLDHVVGRAALTALAPFAHASTDVIDAVLEEAARFSAGVLAPLARSGDRTGATLADGAVRTPPGSAEAYRRYVDAGWNAIAAPADYGGQALPASVAMAVQEMLQSANMAFALCPLLSHGAVDVLMHHGTAAQKERYLPHIVSGAWTVTMCLTEPQAGSDVGALATRAWREGDHYRIKGTKIFITYGDHDWSDNIVHLVLARTEGAPPGTKGISLFIVPKVAADANGTYGARNDVRAVSLEHKLGIHASPTAVMAFGDDGGAWAEIVGGECEGMRLMFTMMNNARLGVGVQGLAQAERAYQLALAYAQERIQGRGPEGPVAIVAHADVRRMLMTMKAQTEAVRALVYYAAMTVDLACAHPDEAARAAFARRTDLLTPIVKAYATDIGFETASLGVQVHGGVGYIEETGAAQILRDARIAMIYEGTNGIQAMDLVGRKLRLEGGAVVAALLDEVRAAAAAGAAGSGDVRRIGIALRAACDALARATEHLGSARDSEILGAGASPYLRLFGHVAAGWLMARAAEAAEARRAAGDNDPYHAAKIATARYFAEQILPQCQALCAQVLAPPAETLTPAQMSTA